MLVDFRNCLVTRIGSKLVTNLSLKFPPHTKHVATVPREIFDAFLRHTYRRDSVNQKQNFAVSAGSFCEVSRCVAVET